MDEALRTGIAIYNDGAHHAAHDAWEQQWLECERDTPAEQLLHGLIQLSGAVHHGTRGNWSGLRGLAESAQTYLSAVPAHARHGVNVESVCAYLAALEADPELIERRPPVELSYQQRALELSDLEREEAVQAAVILAADAGYDEVTFEHAATFAGEALDDTGESQFVTLLLDFLHEPASRSLIAQRLEAHAEKRLAERRDVEGLFDPS